MHTDPGTPKTPGWRRIVILAVLLLIVYILMRMT